MSPGGLMQLVAYGVQDTYLTGNMYLIGSPQVTYFKTMYRRNAKCCLDSIFGNDKNPTDQNPTDQKKGGNLKNNNFIKEMLKLKMYEAYYETHNFKLTKAKFSVDTCDICMEMRQRIKTSCGHKYCHACFIKIHVGKESVCSFCKQNIGKNICLYTKKKTKKNQKKSNIFNISHNLIF